MPRAIHVFRTPDRFVAGTVGQPGNRTFYLQAVHDKRVISVMLEKQQVAVLADAEEGPDAVRVFLTPESAREFANRSNRVISAGRPPCPLCDEPLDPEGHICVRTNGYRRGAFGGTDDEPDT